MVPRRVLKIVIAMVALAAVAAAAAIPSGTPVTVRLNSGISSAKVETGQRLEGTVARDVIVNGKTAVRAGAPVRITVTHAKPSGRLHHPGQLTVRLTSLDGQPIQSSAIRRQGKSHKKSNATKMGGGAATGALIGAVAGGGAGFAIGTLAGGAAGTGLAAVTGKQEAVIPAESALTFTITGSTASKE